MKLIKFSEHLLPEIFSFNKKAFPVRRNIEQSFKERFYENPFSIDGLEKSAFIADEQGKIHGQFLLMPTKFYFQERSYSGHFGVDFILDESLRGKGMGKVLAYEVMRFSNYSGIGPSQASESLHKKFGNYEIANAERFIKFRTLLSPLRLIFRKQGFDRKKVVYPEKLKIKSISVKRRFALGGLPEKPFWNKDIVEWNRGNKFLEWRFFSEENKYALYFAEDDSFYFVVRKVRWKNLNVVLLADYRYTEFADFKVINDFAKKVCDQTNSSAVVTVSSLNAEKILNKKIGFRKFGHSLQVMTNAKEIENAEAVMVTFADSDIDTFYGDNVW